MTPRARRPAPPAPARRRRGIALPAMVFAVVVVALMVAAAVTLLTQSMHAQTLQLQTARAHAAARSAVDWALWQVSDPGGALGLPGDTLPPCFAARTLTLPAPLEALPVALTCTREPASGAVDDGGLKLASYRIVAVAAAGSSSGSDRVQRSVEARHTVCKNPGGTAPLHAC